MCEWSDYLKRLSVVVALRSLGAAVLTQSPDELNSRLYGSIHEHWLHLWAGNPFVPNMMTVSDDNKQVSVRHKKRLTGAKDACTRTSVDAVVRSMEDALGEGAGTKFALTREEGQAVIASSAPLFLKTETLSVEDLGVAAWRCFLVLLLGKASPIASFKLKYEDNESLRVMGDYFLCSYSENQAEALKEASNHRGGLKRLPFLLEQV